jgi:hypothetical protein
VALFVLLIVGVVVIQTWRDWNDTRRLSALPEWASGVGLASVLAAILTAATSFASYWYQESVSQGGTGLNSWLWLQIGFLLCAMGIVVAAVRKKRLRTLLLLAAILTAAFWAGIAFSS